MTDTTLVGTGSAPRARASSDLYRAVWRWHFYAGLLVLPFLIILAVTGALYLFRDEIDAIIHADLKRVEIQEQVEYVRPSAMVAAALAAQQGTAVGYTGPAGPGHSAEITVRTGAGEKLAVYVNPYSGKVLGSMPDQGTVMWMIRRIHSLAFFGPIANGALEIAAGWSILLVGTGIYLWWPRRRGGGVVTVRGTPKKRLFWRDLHAVTGVFVGLFIVFLAVTGMPWSILWGAKVNEWANGHNFGYPAGVRVEVPMSTVPLNEKTEVTWSLEQARMPVSAPASPEAAPIGLDRAVKVFDELGLHPGYRVSIPASLEGVYTGSIYPDDLAQQRVVHLDQYSGKPLIDMGYADYGPMGRALEWGINVHLGQEFGLANQIVLLIACLAIVLLSVSAVVMWWKRKPSGALGVPPQPSDKRVMCGLLAILAMGGALFPLVGASLVVMVILDWALARHWRPTAT